MRWPLWRVAVVERSMEPALHPGDWLLVWRGTRPGRAVRVRPGQLVIARHPAQPDLLLVKRAARREPGGWWLSADNRAAGAADSRTFGVVSGRADRGPGAAPVPPGPGLRRREARGRMRKGPEAGNPGPCGPGSPVLRSVSYSVRPPARAARCRTAARPG